MANFTDVSVFQPVHELGVTEPVLGGPGGNSNVPLQQLANRTKYLLDAIATLESGGGPFALNASLGLLPTTGSGPANAVKRKDLYNVTVAGTISGTPLQVGDQLIAKIDNAAVIGDYIILQASVDLATPTILGLVKLAQDIAGGAAADRVLSITGLINLFAQLISPAFTGNPTAPTQAPGTNNTRIATTKYADDAVAVETAARASAVSGEAGTRAANDGTLSTAITNETNARIAADSAEGVNRNNADVVLQAQITAANNKNPNGLIKMVLPIIDWDMDALSTIEVALPGGYTSAKVVHCSAIIYGDDDDIYANYKFPTTMTPDYFLGSFSLYAQPSAFADSIYVSRDDPNSYFNSTWFDKTGGFLRGYIFLEFLP